MATLRKLGFRIAVDDLGAGYAGLSSFSQLEPDIAKLDMSLIPGIHTSPRKARIVRSMITVCRDDLGTGVVCGGVETQAERDSLESLGAGSLARLPVCSSTATVPEPEYFRAGHGRVTIQPSPIAAHRNHPLTPT
jgi:predicted signal transduction protein with EAL and GGDEF domain